MFLLIIASRSEYKRKFLIAVGVVFGNKKSIPQIMRDAQNNLMRKCYSCPRNEL
jgi:hypothetical protein